MSYIKDYEKALMYSSHEFDETTDSLLENLKTSPEHRYPQDNLSVLRGATADRLMEVYRDDEGALLADPSKHVMIIRLDSEGHPLHGHNIVREAEFNDSIIRDNTARVLRHLYAYHHPFSPSEEISIHSSPQDKNDFIREYRHIIDNCTPEELEELGVSRDIKDHHIFPKIPRNHARVLYYPNLDHVDYPVLPRYEDVHYNSLGKHLHDYLNQEIDYNGIYEEDEELDRLLDAVKNAPYEGTLPRRRSSRQ